MAMKPTPRRSMLLVVHVSRICGNEQTASRRPSANKRRLAGLHNQTSAAGGVSRPAIRLHQRRPWCRTSRAHRVAFLLLGIQRVAISRLTRFNSSRVAPRRDLQHMGTAMTRGQVSGGEMRATPGVSMYCAWRDKPYVKWRNHFFVRHWASSNHGVPGGRRSDHRTGSRLRSAEVAEDGTYPPPVSSRSSLTNGESRQTLGRKMSRIRCHRRSPVSERVPEGACSRCVASQQPNTEVFNGDTPLKISST